MTYNDVLKQIRKAQKKKMSEIQIGKSRYSYSRIEKGETKINLDDLIQILDNLELTFSEFLMFENFDDSNLEYKKLLNQCVSSRTDKSTKTQLLAKYYRPKNVEKKNKKERFFLIGIVGNFRNSWEEVRSLTSDEVIIIYDKLVNQTFFSEYDYLIAMNMVSLLSGEMLDTMVEKLYPIAFKEQREGNIIRYFSLTLLNIVSFSIYNLNYKKALYYLNILEKEVNIQENYYLSVSILYHKNIVLRFLEKDTLYIEKARDVIKLVRDLGDNSLAEAYESELNNLAEDPTYYLNNHKFPVVTPRS